MRPYFTILALLVCLSVKGMDGTFGNMTAGTATSQSSFTATGGVTNLNANVVGTNTATGAHWMIGTNAHMWLVDKFGTKFTYFTNHVSVVWTNGAYGYWTNNGDGTCDMWVNGKVHGNGSLLTGVLTNGSTANLTALNVTNAANFLGAITGSGTANFAGITRSTNDLYSGGNVTMFGSFEGYGTAANAVTRNIATSLGRSFGIYGASGTAYGIVFGAGFKLRGSQASTSGDQGNNGNTTAWFWNPSVGTWLVETNLIESGFNIATNGFLLPTNFSATAFAPVAGLTKLIGSNNAVYVVGVGYTNVVVADH